MQYDMTSQTTNTAASSGDAVLAIGMMLFLGVVILVAYVVTVIAMWRLFAKGGEAGWKALVPIYNQWIFLRLGNQAGWWAIVSLVPFLGILGYVFSVIAAYNIGLKLSKESWWVVLYILAPIVWLYVLAFDKSAWRTTASGTVPSPVDTLSSNSTQATTETTVPFVPPEKKPPIQG